MTSTVRRLEQFSDSGIRIAEMYEIDTDYYYVFVNHNYFIYRIEPDRVIIANMFHEKEDFMMKMFGLSGRTQESIDYWGEQKFGVASVSIFCRRRTGKEMWEKLVELTREEVNKFAI